MAATCLLAFFGIRPSFAMGNLLKQKPRPRAIIENVHKYNDQIVRDSRASDTPFVLCHVPLIPFPISIATLQPLSPTAPPVFPLKSAFSPRAPPLCLT